MKRHISIFTFLLGAVFAVGPVGGLHAGTSENVYARFVSMGGNWNANDTTHITPTSMTLYDNPQQKPVIFTALPPDGYQVMRWLWNVNMDPWIKESDMSEITGSDPYRKVSDDKKTCTVSYSGDGSRALGVRFDYMELTVTFGGNGKTSGEMDDITDKNIDLSFSLTANAYAKTGYSFNGWTNDLAKSFTDKASVKGSDFWDKTTGRFHADLYARWSAKTYTVTFDGNGGGTPSPTSKTVTYDSTYGDLATCTRQGWQFNGWYTAADGGTKIDSGTKVAITANQTLYAHWTQKFKVTFYESTLFEESKVLKDEWVLAGGNATQPEYPTHEGYTPDGWSETYTNVRANKDVWAKYTANPYSVKFHANDGSGRTTTQPFQYGEEKNLLSDPLPRKGYVLEGWTREKTSLTVDYKPGALVSNLATGGTVDLYALWTPISYIVAFNSNGGEGTMDPLTPKYGESFTVPACEFAKAGCEFKFWSAEIGGVATNFEAGAVVSNLTTEAGSTVTFTAEWTGYYTVAFDGNGGEGTMTNLACETDVEYALPSNAFTKTGYRFYGWATNLADAVALKKPAYTNGQTVVNLAVPGGTRTLFAEWTTNLYTVVFNPNGEGVRETMEPQDFFYDQVKPLSPNRFTRGELWSFAGWSNSVGRVFENGESVSNLCADDGGTVDLFARWVSERGPLSEAMGCDNLKWEPEKDLAEEQPLWKVCDSEGSDGPPCVQQINGYWARMYAHITTNGTLTFKVKLTTANDKLVVNVGQLPDLDPIVGETLTFSYQEGAEWQDAVVEVPKLIWDSAYIRIYHWNDWESGTAFVDQMTWTPAGANPEPGPADAVEISSAAVSDGKFILSFPSDERFDYNLLTNANLLINSWGVMETKEGIDEDLTFKPEIIEGQPQLFYKVETIQKK